MGIKINDNMELCIITHSTGIFRLYFKDTNGKEVAAPAGFAVIDEDGISMRCFNGSYFVAWISSYVVKINGHQLATLTTQKKHSIKVNPAYGHYVDDE